MHLKPKSPIESKNKMLFNRFVHPMLHDNISIAFFTFAKSYKNLRSLGDLCKLTCSELFYYTKDSQ